MLLPSTLTCQDAKNLTWWQMKTWKQWEGGCFSPNPVRLIWRLGSPVTSGHVETHLGGFFFQFRILGGDRRPRWVQWQKLRFWRWTSLAFFGILGLLSIKIPPTSPAKKTTLGNNPFFLMDFYREDVPKSEIWQVFPNRSLLWRGFIYTQFRSSLRPIEHLV